MSKPPSLNRAESLYHIQRDLDSLTQWAVTQPDIFTKVVTDGELERLEEIVTYLVVSFQREVKRSGP